MYITPIAPTDIKGSIDKKILKKAEEALFLSATLYGSQNQFVINEVKELLRKVNSYYSNKIEGDGTHIYNIEKAMRNEYSLNTKEKNLQQLSLAHINVQKQIELSIESNSSFSPYSKQFIKDIHKRLYTQKGMDKFLNVSKNDTPVFMKPGEFRKLEVEVGSHNPLGCEKVESVMDEFEHLYSKSMNTSKITQYIHALSSHHRLAWVHPFLDGNGRVSRLALDAALHSIEIPGYGLWNISRGLAKNSEEYKKSLSYADMIRQGATDGRGNLSSRGLNHFVDFMLETSIDQIEYMSKYLKMDELSQRIEKVVSQSRSGFIEIDPLPKESSKLFNYLLIHGEMPRGKAAEVLGLKERSARNVISELVKRDFLISNTVKSPIRIRFDAVFAKYLFPELVPEVDTLESIDKIDIENMSSKEREDLMKKLSESIDKDKLLNS
ncbi:MAG: Fic family protein [Sulfurimonas sp.]|nr:Fic family protein [Sulfurimonas sp.]